MKVNRGGPPPPRESTDRRGSTSGPVACKRQPLSAVPVDPSSEERLRFQGEDRKAEQSDEQLEDHQAAEPDDDVTTGRLVHDRLVIPVDVLTCEELFEDVKPLLRDDQGLGH